MIGWFWASHIVGGTLRAQRSAGGGATLNFVIIVAKITFQPHWTKNTLQQSVLAYLAFIFDRFHRWDRCISSRCVSSSFQRFKIAPKFEINILSDLDGESYVGHKSSAWYWIYHRSHTQRCRALVEKAVKTVVQSSPVNWSQRVAKMRSKWNSIDTTHGDYLTSVKFVQKGFPNLWWEVKVFLMNSFHWLWPAIVNVILCLQNET